ncbi:MAG: 3-phosphoshikimate 1-carboxyvinyltransferase [Parachlamydia sp.]|jgi:3-phosphoshikimate 1-carboxyvinyltransferase|nr:3-phosphoshikimate 1-carboxyvinyltransferase [Parachlamydia sp.]
MSSPTALCVSLAFSTIQEIERAILQATPFADWIEVRMDYLDPTNSTIKRLKELLPKTLLLTLRSAHQGGRYRGDRFAILKAMALQQPAYMDLEADLPLCQIRELQDLSPQTKWILSWHERGQAPFCLDACIERLLSLPGHYYKLAVPVSSAVEGLALLNKAKQINQRKSCLCLIGLGKEGDCTRVLSPLSGQPFTFAALKEGIETAPGQIPLQTMVDVYHFKRLTQATALFGLVGDPVVQSVSHITHNAVLRHFERDGIYYKFTVAKNELQAFMNQIQNLNIAGLSITMPHKKAIASLMESVSPFACNTLHFEPSNMYADNTDGTGALQILGDVKGKKIIILGAGGTAYAIAKAAQDAGGEAIILNRTAEKAEHLASLLGCDWGSLEEMPEYARLGYDILINATSVGMQPPYEMPISPDCLLPGSRVLDAVSFDNTPLMACAREKGCIVHSGVELFVAQAAKQFKRWLCEVEEEKVRAVIWEAHPLSNAIRVKKSTLDGRVVLPPSKSHSIRAILLGAMAHGTSCIEGILSSPDCERALQAAQALGACITKKGNAIYIQGVSGQPASEKKIIDAGNSGQVLRFGAALAALGECEIEVTGDASICSNRPIGALRSGLAQLGAHLFPSGGDYAPFTVRGPLQAGNIHMDGIDSQPVSALLMAASFIDGKTTITARQAGEKPWLALTLSWLDRLGVQYSHDNFERFIIHGKRKRPAFQTTIPGDLSAAAFPLAAALVTRSALIIEGADMEDVQGDKELFFILKQMGASISYTKNQWVVHPDGSLKGSVVDVNPLIDAVPILAVLGCFAEGETQLVNAANARNKESDRLHAMRTELSKMGACIEEWGEGLCIRLSKLKGAMVDSHGDHRIAMALIVAGMGAEGETVVQGVDCIQKSYPHFIEDMQKAGASLERL